VVANAVGSRDLDRLDQRIGRAPLVGRARRDPVTVVANAVGSRDLERLDQRIGRAPLVGRVRRDPVTVPRSLVELVETW